MTTPYNSSMGGGLGDSKFKCHRPDGVSGMIFAAARLDYLVRNSSSKMHSDRMLATTMFLDAAYAIFFDFWAAKIGIVFAPTYRANIGSTCCEPSRELIGRRQTGGERLTNVNDLFFGIAARNLNPSAELMEAIPAYSVRHIFLRGAPFEIFKAIIALIKIDMVDLFPLFRPTQEGRGNQAMHSTKPTADAHGLISGNSFEQLQDAAARADNAAKRRYHP